MSGTDQVYDVTTDRVLTVTTAEAQAGMVRYARSLGAGTAACAVWEQRAVRLGSKEEGGRVMNRQQVSTGALETGRTYEIEWETGAGAGNGEYVYQGMTGRSRRKFTPAGGGRAVCLFADEIKGVWPVSSDSTREGKS